MTPCNAVPMEYESKSYLTSEQYFELTKNPLKIAKTESIEQGYVEKNFNVHIVQSTEEHVNIGNGVFIRTAAKIPFHLMQADGSTIDTSKCAVRFRKTEGLSNMQETVCELEIKHKTDKGMEEYPFKISEANFNSIIEQCDASISKIRKHVKWQNRTLHLDTFTAQAGCIDEDYEIQRLHVLEIEFDSLEEMDAFKTPEEFGVEVKGKTHSNHNFANLRKTTGQFYCFIKTINEKLTKENPDL